MQTPASQERALFPGILDIWLIIKVFKHFKTYYLGSIT